MSNAQPKFHIGAITLASLLAGCLLPVQVAGSAGGASCGRLSEVSSAEELELHLQYEYVFFDLDETIVMPDTPFIYGLPGSDAFLERLTDCEKRSLSELKEGMEAAYYAAPETLVDAGLPALIARLRGKGKTVLALTSRSRTGGDWEWHNHKLIHALANFGVKFSPLPAAVASVGNDTAAGGVIFAQGESKDKAALIARVVPEGSPAALVDNTLKKLNTALKNEDACLNTIHFTAAFDREHDDSSRQSWVCDKLNELGEACGVCESAQNSEV